MNTYTDTQLKQALAKMLPDVIHIDEQSDDGGFFGRYRWKRGGEKVLNTELLHLSWLVEEDLKKDRSFHWGDYADELDRANPEAIDNCHATWQQRTIALAKVKGIEIV